MEYDCGPTISLSLRLDGVESRRDIKKVILSQSNHIWFVLNGHTIFPEQQIKYQYSFDDFGMQTVYDTENRERIFISSVPYVFMGSILMLLVQIVHAIEITRFLSTGKISLQRFELNLVEISDS